MSSEMQAEQNTSGRGEREKERARGRRRGGGLLGEAEHQRQGEGWCAEETERTATVAGRCVDTGTCTVADGKRDGTSVLSFRDHICSSLPPQRPEADYSSRAAATEGEFPAKRSES